MIPPSSAGKKPSIVKGMLRKVAAIQAGKLVLKQIQDYSARGLDFGFESTLSGKSYARLLSRLKKIRFWVALVVL